MFGAQCPGKTANWTLPFSIDWQLLAASLMLTSMNSVRSIAMNASYVGELASKVATSEKQGQQFYLVAQPAERRWCWRGYVAHVDALYDRALVTGCQPTTAPHDAECAN